MLKSKRTWLKAEFLRLFLSLLEALEDGLLVYYITVGQEMFFRNLSLHSVVSSVEEKTCWCVCMVFFFFFFCRSSNAANTRTLHSL